MQTCYYFFVFFRNAFQQLRYLPLVGSLLLLANSLYAFPPDSSLVKQNTLKELKKNQYTVGDKRSFQQISLPESEKSELVDKNKWSIEEKEEKIYKDCPKDAKYRIEAAEGLLEKVVDENLFVDVLVSGMLEMDLPLGIRKKIGNVDYIMLVDSIYNNGKGMYMQVYMSISIPQAGNDPKGKPRRMTFYASDIEITSTGGFTGAGKLELMEDFTIPIGVDTYLTIQSDPCRKEGTYVIFDCSGFKEMGLKAELAFSRNLLLPEDGNGNILPTGNVKAKFQVIAQGWDDIIARISLPAFQVKSLKGVSFLVQDAVFDFSDVRNDPTVLLPADYATNWLPKPNSPLWQGVAIKNLVIKLPKNFKKKDAPNTRIEIRAFNMIIDRIGFSGEVEARNLISREEGTAGKWPFSLEYFYFKVNSNQFQSAKFNGVIKLPITKKDDKSYLIYSALISPETNNYVFNVRYSDVLDVDIWVAKMSLYPNSYIELKVNNDVFYAKAVLWGKMTIRDNKLVYIPDINFEELLLSNEAPYINAKTFSTSAPDQQKLSNYPIAISKIQLKRESKTNSTVLYFDFMVNLDKAGVSGACGLSIYTELKEGNGEQYWVFKYLSVEKVSVKVEKSGFTLEAMAEHYKDDPVYGEGFKGEVKVEFTRIKLLIEGQVQFGNANGTRYWYTEALLVKESGLPILGPASVYAFAGGISQNVSSKFTGNTTSSLLGYEYIPDANYSLGVKAGVILGLTGKKETMNGQAAFELKFNASGGLSYIGFLGMGNMMQDIEVNEGAIKSLMEKLSSTEEVAMFASGINRTEEKKAISFFLKFIVDLDKNSFYGNMGVRVEAPKIAAQGYLALYFAPDDWYIFIGTPQNRFRFKFPLGPLLDVEVNAYLMVGTQLPATIPPPDKVLRILGLPQPTRDETALLKGRGFAFGAGLELSKNFDFLIFYANFSVGAGFDIMVRDYGPDARCEGSNSPIGINGWYATGQAYAYVDGSVGIKVRVFRKERKFHILDIGAAVLLQAKLPNPTWMKGTVGGYFSVLGGLVSGSCRFEVTIGQECKIIGADNILADIKMIDDLTPANGDTDVDVFTSPQAVFSMELDKNFTLADLDGSVRTFYAKLDKFLVQDGAGNPLTVKNLKWSADKRTVAMTTFDVLPPKSQLKVIAQVSFMEYTNGGWKVVSDNGTPVTEIKENTFTTGEAPDFIPKNNIDYTYPVVNQLNFYPGEYPKGYIQLKQGQPYLFVKDENWKGQLLRFSPTDKSAPSENWVSYDRKLGTVNFDIPGNIKRNMVYQWEIINVPANEQLAVDKNVTDVADVTTVGDNTISVTSRQATGTVQSYTAKNIFGEEYFKTSIYSNLDEKFADLTFVRSWSKPYGISVEILGITLSGKELFDNAELQGGTNFDPLITIEADLNTNWFNKGIQPLVYNGLLDGFTISRVNNNPWGMPPSNAIYFDYDNSKLYLSSETKMPVGLMPTYKNINYFISPVIYGDYVDLISQAAAAKIYRSSNWINYILNPNVFYPSIYPGNYPFTLKYTLPGIHQITTQKTFSFNN